MPLSVSRKAATAFDSAVATDDGTRIPSEVVFAMAEGEHPVR